MNKFEKDYCLVLKNCINKGIDIRGRNGITRQITGAQIRADLRLGFPVTTGKQIFPKSVFTEVEWMLKGFTNVRWLNERNVKIWDQWADEKGDLGPVYGHQILNFAGVNQLNQVLDEFKKTRNSRRLVVSMWNPVDLDKMALPPCHYAFQFIVENNYADVVVSMRSLDLFIGLPYDIAMYATILKAFCTETNLEAREVVLNAANAHIYSEHLDVSIEYIKRKKFNLPLIDNVPSILNFKADCIKLNNYKSNNRIKVIVKK